MRNFRRNRDPASHALPVFAVNPKGNHMTVLGATALAKIVAGTLGRCLLIVQRNIKIYAMNQPIDLRMVHRNIAHANSTPIPDLGILR
jgi:hypothetical protein